MSTIEEAREQAREALAQWDAPGGNHSGQVIGFLASALRALLDATEPSTVAVKTEFRVLDAPKDCDYHEGFEEGVKVGRAGSGPRPITDEMVKAAAREYHERGNGEGSYARASEHVRTSLSFRMECALRAAEGARR